MKKLVFIAALAWANVALAQQMPAGVSEKSTAVALTNVSSCPTAAAANPYRKSLSLDNSGGTINVGYCEIQAGQTTCTAAIGTPPTTTLAAGSIHPWIIGAPINGFCFIAASGTPSITFKEGQ